MCGQTAYINDTRNLWKTVVGNYQVKMSLEKARHILWDKEMDLEGMRC
jgi:hypothetical protein